MDARKIRASYRKTNKTGKGDKAQSNEIRKEQGIQILIQAKSAKE
jgi:hypothetical protein